MERLDHFVVHIDNDEAQLARLKEQIVPLGFEFNPASGKGTKGFKVANLWVGDQYLELPRMKSKDGGGWRKQWVDLYNQGRRGVFGLCIMTDRLDALHLELKSRGIHVGEPERITFKTMFGLLKKSLPFRKIYTPRIPGTDLQVFFLEMDSPKKQAYIRKYLMKPNAEKNGITGLHEAFVRHNFSEEAWQFIGNLFPDLTGGKGMKTLDMGKTKLHFVDSDDPSLALEVIATNTNSAIEPGSFQIENLKVQVNASVPTSVYS